MTTRARAALLAGLLMAACGGQQATPSAPAATGGDVTTESADGDAEKEATPAQQPSSPGYGQAPPGTGSTPPQPVGRFAEPPAGDDGLEAAWNDFLQLAEQLESSPGDCTTACRALASMRRARERICTLESADDSRRRCADAESRLELATRKVVAACGTCR